MSYVGCIAGAIAVEEYDRGLKAAGLAHVQIMDSGADLNAYAQVEGQSACCSPAPAAAAASKSSLPVASSGGGCCGSSVVHDRLADLMKRYNVNDYAASVKVFALKPSA